MKTCMLPETRPAGPGSRRRDPGQQLPEADRRAEGLAPCRAGAACQPAWLARTQALTFQAADASGCKAVSMAATASCSSASHPACPARWHARAAGTHGLSDRGLQHAVLNCWATSSWVAAGAGIRRRPFVVRTRLPVAQYRLQLDLAIAHLVQQHLTQHGGPGLPTLFRYGGRMHGQRGRNCSFRCRQLHQAGPFHQRQHGTRMAARHRQRGRVRAATPAARGVTDRQQTDAARGAAPRHRCARCASPGR